ncbi:glycosyltransferase family 4 protein [Oceanospirillaceae bacterium]|nr:glycosyltransferase family 4 protein [Oceanospirillaceae bacterium]
MKILIFSEEYIKITKGMFVVWRNYVSESSERYDVDILLNKEHWAVDELEDEFGANENVVLHQLPFKMPTTIVKMVFGWFDQHWILRGGWHVFGQCLNLLFSPLVIIYLTLWLRQAKPIAMFSHNGGWPAGVLCRWILVAAFLARVPRRILIIHSHPHINENIVFYILFRPIRWLQARVMDYCATTIVTVSDSVKASLVQNVFERSVKRIHNGIPKFGQTPIDQVSEQPTGRVPHNATIGFVGALYPMKGPHVLLDAFKLIDIRCELALLGPADPVYLKTLQQKAEQCPNKVSFLGFQSDVDAFMDKLDFLVVPSIAFESFGIVILEAMRCKIPVICSDFGGMKEVVEDGITGLVVPANDALALASAMTRLLFNTELSLQMGEAGYKRFNELFTSEKMAAQYDELIN